MDLVLHDAVLSSFVVSVPAETGPATRAPDIDENGVDLAQVRAMLDLTPAERLERVFGFTRSLLAARDSDAGSGSS